MKPIPAILILFLSLAAQAQITFPVCDVEPATISLQDTAYEAVMEFLALRERNQKEFLVSSDSLPRPRLESCGRRNYNLVNCYGNHPLAQAVKLAYYEHRPLVFSPDMIWLMIAQGYAAHVDAHAETLREQLVSHQGRKTLVVKRSDYRGGDPDYNWPSVFEEFQEQIARHSDPELAGIITAEFSTTGPEERAAFAVSLMDAMSSYFLYVFFPVCGIPEITLEGTAEDWRELERRFDSLRPYLPEWWAVRLQPILQEFAQASSGKVNTAFWQNIFHRRGVDMICTEIDYVSGWILDFFPYIKGDPNPWLIDTDAVARYETAWTTMLDRPAEKQPTRKKRKSRGKNAARALNLSPEDYSLPILTVADLPMGLAKAEVLMRAPEGDLDYQFQAGFVGIRQDEKTLALRPEINWLVVDQSDPCNISAPLPATIEAVPGFDSVSPHGQEGFPIGLDSLKWVRHSGAGFELFVHADGPGGSGRYWQIIVGHGPQGATAPTRGFCFETSTLGWRTLQKFEDNPIPWTEDVDGDGNPELIVWSSFFAGSDEETSPHPSGLMAWVYRVSPEGFFKLDPGLTFRFASRIIKAYRTPVGDDEAIQKTRDMIADCIELFCAKE